MEKDDSSYIHYLHNVVTNLPKNEEEKKKQNIYSIFISILILLPIIVVPIVMDFNHYLIGTVILFCCWGMTAIISINKRKKITKSFYKIENAHTKFNLINIDDVDIIKKLYENSALTFIANPSDKLLDFIFNWLNNEGVLNRDLLDLYIFNGSTLKKAFSYSKVNDDMIFLSIFLSDLDLNDSNLESFSKAHFLVGARCLDDIVGNDKTDD